MKKEGFYFLSSFIDEKLGYSVLEIPKESVLSYYNIKKNMVRNVWRAEKVLLLIIQQNIFNVNIYFLIFPKRLLTIISISCRIF